MLKVRSPYSLGGNVTLASGARGIISKKLDPRRGIIVTRYGAVSNPGGTPAAFSGIPTFIGGQVRMGNEEAAGQLLYQDSDHGQRKMRIPFGMSGTLRWEFTDLSSAENIIAAAYQGLLVESDTIARDLNIFNKLALAKSVGLEPEELPLEPMYPYLLAGSESVTASTTETDKITGELPPDTALVCTHMGAVSNRAGTPAKFKAKPKIIKLQDMANEEIHGELLYRDSDKGLQELEMPFAFREMTRWDLIDESGSANVIDAGFQGILCNSDGDLDEAIEIYNRAAMFALVGDRIR